MAREITWSDAEEIGIQLQEKFPDVDPFTVRFTDLHKYVTELEGFADDPAKSNEPKLEAIQMAWHERIQRRPVDSFFDSIRLHPCLTLAWVEVDGQNRHYI